MNKVASWVVTKPPTTARGRFLEPFVATKTRAALVSALFSGSRARGIPNCRLASAGCLRFLRLRANMPSPYCTPLWLKAAIRGAGKGLEISGLLPPGYVDHPF